MRWSSIAWSIGVTPHDSDVRFAPLLFDIENRIRIYSYNKHSYLESLRSTMQKKYESKGNQEESSSCNYKNRSFSEEMAKWGKLLRKHWFPKSDKKWTIPKQFFFTYLGALTFFSVVFTTSLTSGVLTFQTDIFLTTIYFWTTIIFILSGFFGFILAWGPKKTGPVRLYISGVSLPALVMYIVFLPYRFQGVF